MGTPIAAIGVKIGYQAGAYSSTYPSSGFTHIPNIKSHTTLSGTPNTADATTFDNLVNTTAVALLGSGADTVDFTANMNDEFITAWSAVCNAVGSNNGCWFVIYNPKLTKGVVFYGTPNEIFYGEETANTLAEITATVVRTSEQQLITPGTGGFFSTTPSST